MRRRLVLLAALAAIPGTVRAQDYLLRLDARLQGVAYRGLRLDSVPAADVDTAANGTLFTPDGFVAYCPVGGAECEYYRPGGTVRGAPLVTSADLTIWRLGVQGLSLHANARAGGDLAGSDRWPGTEPVLELLEAYAQYRRGRLTGQLGRVVHTGRLGYTGFDGASLRYQSRGGVLTGQGYLGFGLARGAAIPVTSPEANPLREFQPAQRQLVAGLTAGWRFDYGELRAEYQREVDRETRNWVSERAALEAQITPLTGLRLEAGTEYDIARGEWGSAEADLSYDRARFGASAGVRQYRPYFDLWSLWGVFSPVGYDAVRGRAWARPTAALDLRLSGESYTYEETHATTALTSVEDEGWRWAAGATWRFAPDWAASANYHAGKGAGAGGSGWDGSVRWAPRPTVALTLDGGRLDRPLEYRYGGSELLWLGLSGDFHTTERVRLGLSATWFEETRERPDAAGIEWDQVRLVARVSYLIGTGADQLPLPPAVRRRENR